MRRASAIRVLGSVNSLTSPKINGEAQSIVSQLSHTVIPVQRVNFPWSISSEPIQIRCYRSGRHRDDPSIRLVTMFVCLFLCRSGYQNVTMHWTELSAHSFKCNPKSLFGFGDRLTYFLVYNCFKFGCSQFCPKSWTNQVTNSFIQISQTNEEIVFEGWYISRIQCYPLQKSLVLPTIVTIYQFRSGK